MDPLVIGYTSSILAGLSLIPLTKLFVAIWDRLFRDLPDISGKWSTKYKFVVEGQQEVTSGETADVQKCVRWCKARASKRGSHNRTWKLKGTIRGRYWSGIVQAGDKHSLSGAGVFQLKIWEHGRKMEGYMMWWDGALDRIYVTPYRWQKEPETPG